MAMAWLGVMTKPRQEAKAAAHLVEQSFEVYLPQTPKRDPLGRVVGEEPLFPGNCFCGVVKGQSIAGIRSTPGVLAPVRFGQQIAYLSAPAIARVQAAEAALRLSASARQLNRVAIIGECQASCRQKLMHHCHPVSWPERRQYYFGDGFPVPGRAAPSFRVSGTRRLVRFIALP